MPSRVQQNRPIIWFGSTAYLILLISCVGRPSAPVSDVDAAQFIEVTEGAAATDQASSAGVSWIDIDDDARPELIVTNGYDVSLNEPTAQPNRVYTLDISKQLQTISLPGLTSEHGFSSYDGWNRKTLIRYQVSSIEAEIQLASRIGNIHARFHLPAIALSPNFPMIPRLGTCVALPLRDKAERHQIWGFLH